VTINQITDSIIGAAIEVHRRLGPGLLESAYETCLAAELAYRGLQVERQRPLSLEYRGAYVGAAYRIDLFVECRVVVEVKSVTKLEPVHAAQVLTYLRLSGAPVGLLFNFNEEVVMEGCRRIVLNYRGPTPRSPRPPR